MKKVLLVGNFRKGDSISSLFEQGNYKIVRTKDADKAARLIKHSLPDFVLCTGRMRQTTEGQYFVEL